MEISRLLKISIVINLLAVSSVFAKQSLHWVGEWRPVRKSLTSDELIKGYIEESTKEVTLSFTQDLGIVTVTVTSPDGNIIYQENVKTDVVPNFTIPLEQTKGCIVSVTDGDNLIYTTIDL